MKPYNITYLTESQCDNGFGCLFWNINQIGNYWPFLALFILIWVIIAFTLIMRGNHFLKSVTAASFVMAFIAIIAKLYDFMSSSHLIIVLIITAILAAANAYMMRRY